MSEFNAQEIIDNHQGRCKTRDGREVTQLTLFVASDERYTVVGVLEGRVQSWTSKGLDIAGSDTPRETDLIMPRTVVMEWYNKVPHAFLGIAASGVVTRLYSDDTGEAEVVK